MKIARIVRRTYRVYSEMGTGMMKDFIDLKESGLEYWEATKELWARHAEKSNDFKTAKIIRRMEWKPAFRS